MTPEWFCAAFAADAWEMKIWFRCVYVHVVVDGGCVLLLLFDHPLLLVVDHAFEHEALDFS